MKKRVNNDIFINWTILRNEVAEDFSDAVNVKLVARIVNSKDLDITDFSDREDNVFYIRIPANVLNIGTYTLILTYQKPDATIVGGFASHGLDIKNAFEVVRNSEHEDDEGRDITSDAHYAVDGATFIPAITEVEGDISLSWTNNRALPNPDPVILNEGVPEAVLAANNAATLANQKAGLAQEAADNADSKAELATEKAILANQKATEANNAAVLANQRAGEALSATTAANTAADNANSATQAANSATTQTLAAKSATEQATTQATNAAVLANEKAGEADTAAIIANNAAILANSKATIADEKATAANNAAALANEKAGYANTQGDFAKTQGELAQTARENIEGDLALKIDKASITNELGDSEELVVSQKGVKNEVQKLQLADTQQSHSIKTIEDTLNSINVNQEAKITSEGYGTVSLPKNAANGGMSVKLEGLTEEVEGESLSFLPTGRVRSVGKNLFEMLNQTIRWSVLTIEANKYRIQIDGSIYTTIRVKISNIMESSTAFKNTWQEERLQLIDGAPYSFSVKQISGSYSYSSQNVLLRLATSTNQNAGSISFPDGKFSNSDHQRACLYIIISSGTTFTNYEFTVQIEKGTKATPYEPYKETNLYLTAPELRSNGTVKDEIRKGINGYELIQRINPADGTVRATPVITPISHAGLLNSNSNGTVYHEPVIADAGVYDTGIAIQSTDYPISEIEKIIKWDNGVEYLLDVADAVIAVDGLSFTHPDLSNGDLVMFTYAYDLESTVGKMTLTHYDSRYVIADTANGKFYKQKIVSTNGVASIVLEEV